MQTAALAPTQVGVGRRGELEHQRSRCQVLYALMYPHPLLRLTGGPAVAGVLQVWGCAAHHHGAGQAEEDALRLLLRGVLCTARRGGRRQVPQRNQGGRAAHPGGFRLGICGGPPVWQGAGGRPGLLLSPFLGRHTRGSREAEYQASSSVMRLAVQIRYGWELLSGITNRLESLTRPKKRSWLGGHSVTHVFLMSFLGVSCSYAPAVS